MANVGITEKIIKLVTEGDIDQAFELAKIHDIEPKILIDSGITYGKEGNAEIAGRFFQLLTMLDESNYNAWGNWGKALIRQGKLEESIRCYDKVIEINPKIPRAWTEKGNVLEKQGKYEEAVSLFEEALKLNPRFSDAWYNKGATLDEIGKTDEAMECYDKAIEFNPNYSNAWYNKGVTLSSRKDYPEAIKCFARATEIDPDFVDAWFNKGLALAHDQEQAEAIRCFDKVIALDPKNADAWYNKGIIQESQKNHSDALESLGKSIELNPYNFESWYNKGAILINSKKYVDSIPFFDKAIELNPNFTWAWDSKGRALATIEYQMESLKYFEKAIEIDPLYSDAWFNKGTKLSDMGDFERAIECFDKAVEINSEYAEAIANKGICLLRLGKPAKARDAFRKAKSVFKKQKRKWDYNQALKYELLAKDADASTEKDEAIDYRYSRSSPTSKFDTVKREPEVIPINIDQTRKEWVRVCLIQLDILLTDRFPYKIQKTEVDKTRKKILRALEIAKGEGVDIVCFPELSFDETWTAEVINKCKEMIIVCGSYYDNTNRNICMIIINGRSYFYAKCHPSIFEEKNGAGMEPGNKLFIFQTIYGRIAVFTCIDFDHMFASLYTKDVADIIINPRYDLDKDHAFQNKSNMIIDEPTGSKSQSFILHINANKISINGDTSGGGTCVIGHEHKYFFDKLIKDGLRPDDSILYKAYEAKDELMLIADVRIRTLQRPRIRSGNWYQYDGNDWLKLCSNSIWSQK